MNWLRTIQLRFRALFQKRKLDAEMDAEMLTHIEMLTQENVEAGMEPQAARHAALRQFGWTESIQETCREQRSIRGLEDLLQDLRFALRTLARKRSFTVPAVLMLALGIGATTAILSVFYGMLLKRLPCEEHGRLVTIRERADWNVVSPGAFNDWRENSASFEGISLLQAARMNLTGDGEPRFALCWAVSANFFDVLGVRPQLGRGFLPGDDQPGHDNKVVLLTDFFWKSRFGSETNVIGRTVRLNSEAYSIIGVLPEDAALLLNEPLDCLMPLVLQPEMRENRKAFLASVWGRLKPEVTIRLAEAELRTVKERLRSQYPKDRANLRTVVIPIGAWLFGYIKPTMLMLLGGVLCVLLIVWANVAGLLLARAAGRQKEMGLRAALGAGRGRMARQLLTEGALLGVLGGAMGLLVAFWGVALLRSLLSEAGGASRFLIWATHLDLRILLFSLGLSLAAGILSSLVPALAASAPELYRILKEGARSLAGRPRNTIRNGLVISEIALTLALLMVMGLFMKSVAGLLSVPLGYNPQNAVSVDISLPSARYPDEPARARFFQQVFERLAAQSGIEAIAAATSMPMGFSYSEWFFIEGRNEQPQGGYQCHYDVVRGRYLQTLGIPIRRGRDFRENDYAAKAAPVCLLNEALARRLFADEESIGRHLRQSNTVYEIVGIVGNTRHDTLIDEKNPDGRIYLSPAGSLPGDTPWLFVRSSLPPMVLSPMISKEINHIDAELAAGEFATLQEDVLRKTANQRLILKVLGVFGGVAVLLAAIGLYGVITWEVTMRTGEFGVRMALGAQRADVLMLVLRKGLVLTASGIVLGIAGALAIERAIRSQLYEAKATDPLILAIAVSGCLIVAFAACWLPARRATNVDPMTALRCE